MLSKVVKYALVVILVASFTVAVYSWLDTAVSLNHARQQQKTDEENRDLLRKFILASSRNIKRGDIVQMVEQDVANRHIVKEERNSIAVDSVIFRFDDAQFLKDIQFLDQSE